MPKSSIIRLNLGCGSDHRSGFINVDVDARLKPDLIHDLTQPLPFSDSSVSEILLQDVLEHFTKEDGIKLLTECARVLTIGGNISIRVPNVLKILKHFRKNPDVMMLFIYGDTSENGVWGAHKYGYTPEIMEDTLLRHGIRLELSTEQDTNFFFKGKKLRDISQFQILTKNVEIKDHVQKKLRQYLPPKTFVVYSKVYELILFTIISKVKKESVIWYMDSVPSTFIGKTALRMLSIWVEWVVTTDISTAHYVRDVLHFSHLRTVELFKN